MAAKRRALNASTRRKVVAAWCASIRKLARRGAQVEYAGPGASGLEVKVSMKSRKAIPRALLRAVGGSGGGGGVWSGKCECFYVTEKPGKPPKKECFWCQQSPPFRCSKTIWCR